MTDEMPSKEQLHKMIDDALKNIDSWHLPADVSDRVRESLIKASADVDNMSEEDLMRAKEYMNKYGTYYKPGTDWANYQTQTAVEQLERSIDWMDDPEQKAIAQKKLEELKRSMD